MSSKEQSRADNDKASSKQGLSKSATENLGVIAQEQMPWATIIQQTKLDPGLLSPHAILQLQRTVGNRAVHSALAQTGHHQLLQKEEGKTDPADFSPLIVEDSVTDLSPGQMKKGDFLKELYQALYKVGTEEYEGTNLTVEGCPYIVYWFDRYGEESSSHIERALRKYVSASSITSTEEFIHLITERARRGFRQQVNTGAITELPEDVPSQLGDDIVPEPDTIVQRKIEGIQRTPKQRLTSNVKTNIVQRGNKKSKSKKKDLSVGVIDLPKFDFEQKEKLPVEVIHDDLEDLFAPLRESSAKALTQDQEERTVLTETERRQNKGFALLPMLLKYVIGDKKTATLKYFKGTEREKTVYKLRGGILVKVEDETLLDTTKIDPNNFMKIMNVLSSELSEKEIGELKTDQAMLEKAEEIGSNYIFVMNASGDIFAAEEEANVLHHSSFLAGGAVAAAGHIRVRNGVIEWVNNVSGHYHPGPAYLWQALVNMQQNGVDLNNVQVEILNVERKFKNAAQFVEVFNPSKNPKLFDTGTALKYLNGDL